MVALSPKERTQKSGGAGSVLVFVRLDLRPVVDLEAVMAKEDVLAHHGVELAPVAPVGLPPVAAFS